MVYVIIKIIFFHLNSLYSISFAKHFLLSNTKRYHIIDNEITSIYIALDITSRWLIKKDFDDAWSFYKRVSNAFWNAKNKIE